MSGVMQGRAALVTGGGSGLGAAIAQRLAVEGARVCVMDIDEPAAQRVVDSISSARGRALMVAGDVTVSADVERAAAAASIDGALHALVLSAAVETRSSIVDCTDEDWDRILGVNLRGPFLCMRAAIPRMVAAGGGSIVALGSVLGAIPAPQYAAYCTSKGALVNLCKQAAIENAAAQVRVNVVSPSACDAGLFLTVVAQAENPQAVRDMVAANIPMRRLGTADEVCDAVLFLLSDASRYTSGMVLPLDGGLAARRM
jgi:NAD(P)-dependent dehydrogenase (short-subunit alcohol dehydrogenase family)